MKFYSELTESLYETADECVAAEKEYIAREEEKELEHKKLEQKKAEMMTKAQSIIDEYLVLRKEYIDTFGTVYRFPMIEEYFFFGY